MPSPRPIPLIAVLLTLLAVVESWAAPPVLNRLSIPSPMADVSVGQVQLPIEIDFSAPEGISRVEMSCLSAVGDAFYHYVSPSLQQSSITGTVKAGIYRGYLVIPGFRPADTWTLSAINPTLGTGTLLKIKGWKSTTLAPGSWSPLSAYTEGYPQRYFRLDVSSYLRRQQFLRLTVEP